MAAMKDVSIMYQNSVGMLCVIGYEAKSISVTNRGCNIMRPLVLLKRSAYAMIKSFQDRD